MKKNLIACLCLLSFLLSACQPALPPAATAIPPYPTTLPPSAVAAPSATGAKPTETAIESAAAQPAANPTLASPAAATELAASLMGLGFDAFVEESYKRLLLRDPEGITELGLSAEFGVGNDRLTDISDAYMRQTQALEKDILALLKEYDRAALTPDQNLTAEVYAWWLEDRVSGHAFMYADYPISHFLYSIHNDLLQFFTDLHPIATQQDAQDYVTRLSQVDDKFAEVVAGLERRQQQGVVLPAYLFPQVLSDLKEMANSPARSTPYYSAFANKLNQVPGLSAADKQALLAEAEKEINASVIPAYRALLKFMSSQQAAAADDLGVWKFPDGAAYYDYLLRHYTTTGLSADEIHALGLQELQRIQAEMRAIFDQLGYPKDESLAELYNRVAQDGGMVYGSKIVSTYEDILQKAEQEVSAAFGLRPQTKLIVIGAPYGGYYIPGALDGSRPGAFYATDQGVEARFAMATVAYHEGIPGHHFQIAIAQERSLPAVRRGSDFTGYIEGWALYAERLAWELGFYENDPYGNLGRLQLEAMRAARLVVDTGIHAKQWRRDQALQFMLENTGARREYEIDRYVVLPGQATAYYVGYLKILELRQKAKDALGERFDLKEFHNVILGGGAMPLATLEQLVEDYIAGK